MTLAPPGSPARTAAPTRPRSVLILFVLPWLLLSLLGALWALATPIGGSPDEPAHVVKAGSVVRGEFVPSSMIAQGGVLHVPAALAFEYQQSCFAFLGDTAATCAPEFAGDPGAIVETYSSASLYDPVYYLLVGWPSLLSPDEAGIYGMRIVSALLCSFFVAACFWMIGSWPRRRLPALGVLIGLTPIAVYLLGTVNPNALEFTGGLAIITGMLGIVQQPDERLLRSRLALVVVASALVANTRGISPLWVALLLVVPLVLLKGRALLALLRRPAVIVSIVLIAASALFSAWWTLSTNTLGTAPSTAPEVTPTAPGVGLTPVQGFFGLIGMFYSQLRQMVGILGWLDTPLSPPVYYISYLLFALLVVGTALWVRGRALVFVVIMALLFFFLPPLIQAAYVTRGGYIWQGRYTLVLLMALLVSMAACIAASDRFRRREEAAGSHRGLARLLRILPWAVGALWTIGIVWSFATTLRRFSVGYSVDWAEMVEPGAWTPPVGVVPLVVLFALTAAAFAVSVVLAGRDRAPALTDERS